MKNSLEKVPFDKKRGRQKILRRMKLLGFFLLLSIMQVAASVKGQNAVVSLKINNVSLVKLFDEIANQTDYEFLYNHNLVANKKQVSVNVKEVKLQHLLQQVLSERNLDFELDDNVIVVRESVAKKETQQKKKHEIKGKVVDEQGVPLPGVSVVVKGTTIGVSTNIDGNYTLKFAQDKADIVFSFVGMVTQTITYKRQAVLNITLKSANKQVDEVMVVAYGSAKKSSFTGSATVVKKEDIQKISTSNVTKALQGLSTGVQVINNSGEPGSSATIMIRGIGSINASSAPLYVVDGVPYSGSINAISSSDISSITVLKDASATALYGSRAANGVIVITTKKGSSKEGTLNFKANVSFPKLATDFPRKLTPQEYSETTWMANYLGYLEGGKTDDEARKLASATLVQNLGINPWNSDNPIGTDGKLVPGTELLFEGDWLGECLSSRPRQEYTLDFSGKKGDTDYFISGSYVNDKGLFTTSEFERYSGRVNVSSKIKEWLKVGSNTSFAHSKSNNGSYSTAIWFLRTVPSIYPIYQYDFDKKAYKTDANGNKIFDYGVGTRKEWGGWNPLADAEYNKAEGATDNFSTRNFIEFQLLPELKFKSNLSVDYSFTQYSSYASADYGSSAGVGGAASKSDSRYVGTTWNNLLTYDKDFGMSKLSLLLGHESYSISSKSLSGSKEGFPFGGLYELASAAEMTALSSHTDSYKLLSFFGRAEYSYNDKYYVSGSLRTDGSSRFSKESRWGTFWSIGGSWRLSQEDFLKDEAWIDNLKLKASYGAVGNDGLATYYAYQGLYATGYDDFGKAGVMIQRLPNETLKWETNLQFNVGVDFSFWNRLIGSVEYFDRKSKDLLFPMPLAPSTGIGTIDRNVGDVRNYGIEMQFRGLVVDQKDFKWTVDLNGTHYKNIITKLPQKEMAAGIFKWREGESQFNFWGAEYAGVNPETGNDQWWKNVFEEVDGEKVVVDRVKTENSSEVIGDEQKQYLGESLPDIYGGLTNTFSYKGIDLSFMFYYSIGGKLYDGDYVRMLAYKPGFNWHPDVLDAWTPEKHTNSTRFTASTAVSTQQFSSKYIYDNSFVRLRNITLGYTLPSSVLEKLKIKSLRVYASADNILTFGSAVNRGTDPEQSISGTTGNRFPTTKSITFGIQLSL